MTATSVFPRWKISPPIVVRPAPVTVTFFVPGVEPSKPATNEPLKINEFVRLLFVNVNELPRLSLPSTTAALNVWFCPTSEFMVTAAAVA